MESLLTLAFDGLTSTTPTKVRRGLRQLSGLLSQICLSHPTPPSNRPQPKALKGLASDPAFRAFVRLQDNFQYNVCVHLISCLERLLGKGSSGENDLLIIGCLELLVGCLLLHAPSRELWAREVNVNLFLDLLDPSSCPAIHIATLRALTVALMDQPANTRVFEELDGLLVVTSLFKSRQTIVDVKREVIEFAYFYLSEEGTEGSEESDEQTTVPSETLLGTTKEQVLDAFRRASREQNGDGGPVKEIGVQNGKPVTRTKTEKEALLGRHLDNVEDLVQDMRSA